MYLGFFSSSSSSGVFSTVGGAEVLKPIVFLRSRFLIYKVYFPMFVVIGEPFLSNRGKSSSSSNFIRVSTFIDLCFFTSRGPNSLLSS